MKVIRFVSRKELRSLFRHGKINNGAKKLMQYFPVLSEMSLIQNMQEYIKYCVGIVATSDPYDDEELSRRTNTLCLLLELPKKLLKTTDRLYPDPDGSESDSVQIDGLASREYTLVDVQAFYLVENYNNRKVTQLSREEVIKTCGLSEKEVNNLLEKNILYLDELKPPVEAVVNIDITRRWHELYNKIIIERRLPTGIMMSEEEALLLKDVLIALSDKLNMSGIDFCQFL